MESYKTAEVAGGGSRKGAGPLMRRSAVVRQAGPPLFPPLYARNNTPAIEKYHMLWQCH